MILNATASDAAASVYMSIGTMGRTRSTRAISEKRTGSNFSWSVEIKETLELPQHSGIAASVVRRWARRAASQLLAPHCGLRFEFDSHPTGTLITSGSGEEVSRRTGSRFISTLAQER